MRKSKGTGRRSATWILSSILAVAAGACAAGHESREPWVAPYGIGGHIRILVFEKDAVSFDGAHLSKKKHHEADWYSWPGTTLQIEFDDSSVFPALNCRMNHCASGPIAQTAALGPRSYRAVVDGRTEQKTSDPTIMIDP